jgi:hypothetical protein
MTASQIDNMLNHKSGLLEMFQTRSEIPNLLALETCYGPLSERTMN